MPSEPQRPKPHRLRPVILFRTARVLLTVALAFGAGSVLRVWWFGRALWNDEQAIAINLRDLSFTELAGPLKYFQLAPAGWLWTHKAALQVLGSDERGLRLPAVISILLVFGLTALITWRAFGPWPALLAVALVVTAPALLYYSAELKQYATEAAVTLAVLATGQVLGRGPIRRHRLLWLGSAVVWTGSALLSMTAPLVLAGAGAGLAATFATARRWSHAIAVAVLAMPGLALGGWLVLRARAAPKLPGQYEWFRDAMPAAGTDWAQLAHWLPGMWERLAANPLSWRWPAAIMIFVVIGLIALIRAVPGRDLGAMLGGLLAAATLAAAVREYPIGDRLAVYLIAPLAILLTSGIVGAMRPLRRACEQLPGRIGRTVGPAAPLLAAAALSIAIVQPAVVKSIRAAAMPVERDFGRQMLLDIQRDARPGDVVLVSADSHKLITWYGPHSTLPIAGLVRARPVDATPCDSSLDEKIAGARRVWYLKAMHFTSTPAEHTRWVAEAIARHGTLIASREYEKSNPLDNRYGWLLFQVGLVSRTAPANGCAQVLRLPNL